jgi:hypothetical protein
MTRMIPSHPLLTGAAAVLFALSAPLIAADGPGTTVPGVPPAVAPAPVPGAAAPTATVPAAQSASGAITDKNGDTFVVLVDQQKKSFTLASGTEVTINGKKAKGSALATGMQVTVTTDASGAVTAVSATGDVAKKKKKKKQQ